MTNGSEPAEAPRRLPRWRRALVATLVVLSVVLVPLARGGLVRARALAVPVALPSQLS